MTGISVHQSLGRLLGRAEERVAIQLAQAEPHEIAVQAMELARTRLFERDPAGRDGWTPSYASAVVDSPEGPAFFIDAGTMDSEAVMALGERVRSALDEAGVRSGMLRVPVETTTRFDLTGPALSLSVFAHPPESHRDQV